MFIISQERAELISLWFFYDTGDRNIFSLFQEFCYEFWLPFLHFYVHSLKSLSQAQGVQRDEANSLLCEAVETCCN